jgi:hypothetical protein
MGEWVKIVEPVKPHYCMQEEPPRPKKEVHDVGSVWKCSCGKERTLTRWWWGDIDREWIPEWS